jgi:ABC-type lipoprotein release transport system permease subunit
MEPIIFWVIILVGIVGLLLGGILGFLVAAAAGAAANEEK